MMVEPRTQSGGIYRPPPAFGRASLVNSAIHPLGGLAEACEARADGQIAGIGNITWATPGESTGPAHENGLNA